MTQADMSRLHGAVRRQPECLTASSEDARLVRVATAHFTFVWRMLRRLGVCHADADDAAQQVFMNFLAEDEPLANGHIRSEIDVEFSRTLRLTRQPDSQLSTVWPLKVRRVSPKFTMVKLFRMAEFRHQRCIDFVQENI